MRIIEDTILNKNIETMLLKSLMFFDINKENLKEQYKEDNKVETILKFSQCPKTGKFRITCRPKD